MIMAREPVIAGVRNRGEAINRKAGPGLRQRDVTGGVFPCLLGKTVRGRAYSPRFTSWVVTDKMDTDSWMGTRVAVVVPTRPTCFF
jgi:hypothetical protein